MSRDDVNMLTYQGTLFAELIRTFLYFSGILYTRVVYTLLYNSHAGKYHAMFHELMKHYIDTSIEGWWTAMLDEQNQFC